MSAPKTSHWIAIAGAACAAVGAWALGAAFRAPHRDRAYIAGVAGVQTGTILLALLGATQQTEASLRAAAELARQRHEEYTEQMVALSEVIELTGTTVAGTLPPPRRSTPPANVLSLERDTRDGLA